MNVANIGPLPMDDWDMISKEEFLKRCDTVMDQVGLEVQLGQKVIKMDRLNDFADGQLVGQARFQVHTDKETVTTRNVILAVGARGAPRQFGCPGDNHPMIQYHLTDPQTLAGQQVVVVGGGNSALEAAIAIGELNKNSGYQKPLVTLVYRGEVFKKASDHNQRQLNEAVEQGLIHLELSMNPSEVGDGYINLTPSRGSDKQAKHLTTQAILCMIGSLAPSTWMKKLGVEYMDRPQGWSPSSSDDLSFLEL